uniref:Uncharacterized protein n=1 Tax=Timema poppense TaxID=170557 RepID=A0A7R9DIW5_TIMPO|nr:unnamed protein product [Timema poppensis]
MSGLREVIKLAFESKLNSSEGVRHFRKVASSSQTRPRPRKRREKQITESLQAREEEWKPSNQVKAGISFEAKLKLIFVSKPSRSWYMFRSKVQADICFEAKLKLIFVSKPSRSWYMFRSKVQTDICFEAKLKLIFVSKPSRSWYMFRSQVEAGICFEAKSKLTGNVQCLLATHTTKLFEPKFLELLIGNIPEEDIEIVFMGLAGYVFVLAVDLATKQTLVLKLLFHSAHSVANILPLKGASLKFCSHIAIIISTGSVVSVTPDPAYKSLEYATAYLPTHVASVCGVHDKILCGDKVDLWLCQIQGDMHVDMKSKMLPIKGVTAVCAVVGTSNAVTVTSYGNMYQMDVELCLNEERDSLVHTPMETDVESTETSEIFEAICSATKQLETLNYEIAKENRILEGISLAMRVDHLKTYFQVKVKVHDTGHVSSYVAEEHNPGTEIPNRLGNYILEMDVANSTNETYDSPTWSLNVCVNIEKESFINMIPLAHGLSRNHPFKLLMPISIPTPGVPVKLSCNLVSRLLRPSLESNRSWIIVPVADLTLDVSYFLTPRLETVALRCVHRKYDITSLTDDLLRMAQQNILGKIEINYVEQVRLNNNVDKKYELKLRHKTELKTLWVEVVKNCLHRNLKFKQSSYMEGIGEDVPKSLALYLGSSNLKLDFNPGCNTLTVLCTDLKILHAMKRYLLTLGLSGTDRRVVYIDSRLFTEAKRLSAPLSHRRERADTGLAVSQRATGRVTSEEQADTGLAVSQRATGRVTSEEQADTGLAVSQRATGRVISEEQADNGLAVSQRATGRVTNEEQADNGLVSQRATGRVITCRVIYGVESTATSTEHILNHYYRLGWPQKTYFSNLELKSASMRNAKRRESEARSGTAVLEIKL